MYQAKIGYTTVTWAVAGGTDWMEQGMRDIAALGFRAFETFSNTAMDYDDPPGRFRALLDELNLHVACLDKIRSVYQDPTQTEAIIADHEEATRFLLDHGGEILMTVPIGAPADAPRWTLEEFKIVASTLDEIGKRTLDMGATMALHPHWGTYVQSAEEIDLIMELTDPRYVFFAPDSGQIAKGDGDPVAIARKYAERIAHVHLKMSPPIGRNCARWAPSWRCRPATHRSGWARWTSKGSLMCWLMSTMTAGSWANWINMTILKAARKSAGAS